MSPRSGDVATSPRRRAQTKPWRQSWPTLQRHLRQIGWQVIVLAIIGAVLVALAVQAVENLRERGIASGFDYLWRTAGFEIAPGPIAYASTDTYARALTLGLLNTLRVAIAGALAASVLGVAIGIARLSRWRLLSIAARAYVELLRNTPLLLQLLCWYALTQRLPASREAFNPLPSVYLSVSGLFVPGLSWQHGAWQGGMWQSGAWHGGAPAIVWPAFAGFDFHGGWSITPEFAALFLGLSTCTAAFIAEIVRGGILAIDRGQTEAASALGLSRAATLRFVVLPQALRLIVPPLTSQYLNLAKNSSLAMAVGYPDLMSITNTTLNQTGQAIEAIALAMAVYLCLSLAASFAMNAWHRTLNARDGRTSAA
jgi:general L-amino acid transport system permease protein